MKKTLLAVIFSCIATISIAAPFVMAAPVSGSCPAGFTPAVTDSIRTEDAGIPKTVKTDTSEIKVDTLDEAVVTAVRKSEIIPSQTLAGEQLKKLSANSVTDALRYFSGVQIKDYGGIGGLKTVNVRSLGSQHVGVFYDGIQIGNAQNGTVDLGRFSMDNMEMISVYNGQKSDIFQSAKDFASAAAFYMRSRRPVFGEKRNNFDIKIRTGSFDLIDGSLTWDFKINDRVSASVNAEVMNTSGKYKFRYKKTGLDGGGYDTTETRRNGDVFSIRAEAAVFGKIRGGDWDAKIYFYNSDRGYPGAAVKEDYGISLLNEDRQKDRNIFIQTSLTQTVSKTYSYRFRAKYSNDYMNYVMPPESTVQPMDNHYWQQELYFTTSHLFSPFRFWHINLAADLQWNRLDAKGTDMFNANFIQPRRITALAALATSFNLDCGLDMQASVLYTYVHDMGKRKDIEPAKDKNIFAPAAILSYRPWKKTDLTFRAFYKKIFRMPTFNDLYYVQTGSRDLRPEYTTQYDIGAAYRKRFAKGVFAGIEATADAYYNTVKDKIIATPTSNQLVWTMVNLGLVRIKGIDIMLAPSFRFGKVEATARLSYTFQKAQDFTEEKKGEDLGPGVEDYYGDQIPYVPVHSGSAVINCTYGTWSFNYSFIYTGERWMLGGNIPVNYIQPWYTSDISIAKTFGIRDTELSVTLDVNNIFNQQYEVVKWYPMPGTNFKITLGYSF